MSLKRDQPEEMPNWLKNLDPCNLKADSFPLRGVLEQSLYYPSAGFDGRPIQYLGGFVHSFIYVDYGIEEREIDNQIQVSGFLGYRRTGRVSLTQQDLTPNGWRPEVPPQFLDDVQRFRHYSESNFVRRPYATWYIFDRDGNRSEDHGPSRFSLVCLCADGVATYQALYRQNKIAPKVVVVIQPGTGFGGNYTDFRDPNGFFAWNVLDGNGHQRPEFMVCGEFGAFDQTQSFWPEAYPHHVEWFQHVGGNGIWRRA